MKKVWSVYIIWGGSKVRVATGYPTRDDAEWAAGKWKQAYQCFREPFFFVLETVELQTCKTDVRRLDTVSDEG